MGSLWAAGKQHFIVFNDATRFLVLGCKQIRQLSDIGDRRIRGEIDFRLRYLRRLRKDEDTNDSFHPFMLEIRTLVEILKLQDKVDCNTAKHTLTELGGGPSSARNHSGPHFKGYLAGWSLLAIDVLESLFEAEVI